MILTWVVTASLCAGAESGAPTDAKIRLMAEALKARDAGDLNAARTKAEELSKLLPRDPNVRRLLDELNVLAARRAEEASKASERLIDVEIPAPEKARSAPSAEANQKDVASGAAKSPARAATAEEEQRLAQMIRQIPEQRKQARRLATVGRFDDALAVLDSALASLPVTEASKEAVSLLREERISIERRKAAAAKPRKSSDIHQERLAESQAAADDAELLSKGRSQYVAGDSAAARITFGEVKTRDPSNREAQQFLERISQDNASREMTRAGLLANVAQSWEQPVPMSRRTMAANRVTEPSELARKLNEIVLPSVSFTRTDIGQVVAALSAISEEFDDTGAAEKGVNIVLLDPAQKTAAVTLTLRNASLRRVLDFVTASVGYQYELQSDAVVLRPGGETSTLVTDFFPVNRATILRMTGANGSAVAATRGDAVAPAGANSGNASNVKDSLAVRAFLQQAGINFEGSPGASLAYDGSALIVTHTARNLERIRNLLTRYNDVRQVEIEAKFMEVQEGALEELGVNWSINRKPTQHNGANARYSTGGRSLAGAFSQSASNQQGSIVIPGAPAIESIAEAATASGATTTTRDYTPGTEAISLPIINHAPLLPGAANLAAGAGPLATIAGIVGEFDVNAVVRALSQKQGTDLLSAPRVTVLSGNSANITVAQEMRYPQSFGQSQSQVGTGSASGGGAAGVAITAGTPQEFTARNVGVELKVTPTVEEDDFSISLDLNPKVTEFDGFVEYGGPSIAISNGTTVTVPSGFYQPIFSVRDISTRVTLWDGATLVMGGLTREEVKKVNDKVPVLGDLPLIGRLFRSKGESAQKRNLLIFVTAHLVSPGGAPRKPTAAAGEIGSVFANPQLLAPAVAQPLAVATPR